MTKTVVQKIWNIILYYTTYVHPYLTDEKTRIGVFAQGQILCISPNGSQASHPKMNFDRISHHFRSIHNFLFVLFRFHKMAAGGHFGWPKITFDRISRHFRSKRNFDFFWIFFYKMAAGGHFGCPKITFDRISRHFRSIRSFDFFGFFSQNGCRRSFWMTKNHLRSYFSPLQSIRNFHFFDFVHKMAAGGHFGLQKITFDSISRHFISIRNFFSSQNGCRRAFWMAENHFRSHFSPFFWFFSQNGCRGHFGWPKITFDRISSISDQYATMIFLIFSQNGCRRSFWMTENHLRSHFSPLQINTQLSFFWFVHKWLPAGILD